MRMCIGAVSPRVIEEAAKLQVHQIIASRRQVDIGGGYTGLDQHDLVTIVSNLSNGKTQVVRDHGGPMQGGTSDDGIDSFDEDCHAGFNGIHIDVCMLHRDDQLRVLGKLINRYVDKVDIQIGGERDEQAWLDVLFTEALQHCRPTYAVIDLGGHVHADKQIGTSFMAIEQVYRIAQKYHHMGVLTVAHNMDWVGHRRRYHGALDALNIAPEFGALEVDAMLAVMVPSNVHRLIDYAYESNKWTRWFGEHEGTVLERAKCAIRYLMHTDEYVRSLTQLSDNDELFVRSVIRDAIARG